ncbi:hypothetical protein J3A83DRAFT_4186167 [Scleroderma citrinum]
MVVVRGLREIYIDSGSMYMINFRDDESTENAILSHRWIGKEVGYIKIIKPAKMNEDDQKPVRDGDGYKKILASYKRSSAESSEAINSMYRQIRRYPNSNGWLEWFSCWWILQEMTAPNNVQFFNKDWQPIGNKRTLGRTLSSSKIEDELSGGQSLFAVWSAQCEYTNVVWRGECLQLEISCPGSGELAHAGIPNASIYTKDLTEHQPTSPTYQVPPSDLAPTNILFTLLSNSFSLLNDFLCVPPRRHARLPGCRIALTTIEREIQSRSATRWTRRALQGPLAAIGENKALGRLGVTNHREGDFMMVKRARYQMNTTSCTGRNTAWWVWTVCHTQIMLKMGQIASPRLQVTQCVHIGAHHKHPYVLELSILRVLFIGEVIPLPLSIVTSGTVGSLESDQAVYQEKWGRRVVLNNITVYLETKGRAGDVFRGYKLCVVLPEEHVASAALDESAIDFPTRGREVFWGSDGINRNCSAESSVLAFFKSGYLEK